MTMISPLSLLTLIPRRSSIWIDSFAVARRYATWFDACLFVSNFLPSTYQLLLNSCLLLAAHCCVRLFRLGVTVVMLVLSVGAFFSYSCAHGIRHCYMCDDCSVSWRMFAIVYCRIRPVSQSSPSQIPSTCQCVRLLPRALWIWPSPVVSIYRYLVLSLHRRAKYLRPHIHAQRERLAPANWASERRRERAG